MFLCFGGGHVAQGRRRHAKSTFHALTELVQANFDEGLVVDGMLQVEDQFTLHVRIHGETGRAFNPMVSVQSQGQIDAVCVQPMDDVFNGVDPILDMALKGEISLSVVVVDRAGLQAVEKAEVKFEDVSHVLSDGGIGEHLEWCGVLNVVQLQENSLQHLKVFNASVVEHEFEIVKR